jgi:hypothetical protein
MAVRDSAAGVWARVGSRSLPAARQRSFFAQRGRLATAPAGPAPTGRPAQPRPAQLQGAPRNSPGRPSPNGAPCNSPGQRPGTAKGLPPAKAQKGRAGLPRRPAQRALSGLRCLIGRLLSQAAGLGYCSAPLRGWGGGGGWRLPRPLAWAIAARPFGAGAVEAVGAFPGRWPGLLQRAPSGLGWWRRLAPSQAAGLGYCSAPLWGWGGGGGSCLRRPLA